MQAATTTGTCSSPCSNPSCSNNVLTFTISHFDGAGGEGDPADIPEFSMMTLGLGIAIILVGLLFIRKIQS